jgi:hypothetical protein
VPEIMSAALDCVSSGVVEDTPRTGPLNITKDGTPVVRAHNNGMPKVGTPASLWVTTAA